MGLFEKLNQKYIEWYMTKQQKKQAKSGLSKKEIQKRKEIAEGFRSLYHFVKWLNTKGLANRRIRKTFWQNVKNGQPVLEKVILQLVEKYESTEVKKDK